MKRSISANDIIFDFVRNRRNGSVLWLSRDSRYYLRSGNVEIVSEELSTRAKLEAIGFRLPSIQLVEDETLSAYIEENIVGSTIHGVLSKSYTANGQRPVKIDEFYVILLSRILDLQMKAARKPSDFEVQEFLDSIGFDQIKTDISSVSKAVDRLKSIVESNLKLLPWSFAHGDFSPFNISESGIVFDFEDALFAPVGIDYVTFYRNWEAFEKFDSKVTPRREYEITDQSLAQAKSQFEVAYKKVSSSEANDQVWDLLFLLRSFWLSCGLQGNEKFRFSRAKFFENVLKSYSDKWC